MNETELERLVVRLTGDGASYLETLKKAGEQTLQTAKTVETAGAKIEGISKSLHGFAGAAVGALGTLGVAASLGAAFKSFEDKEKAVRHLNSAIEAGGHSAASVLPIYQEWAKQVESVTTKSKGEVLSLLRQAEVLGFSGDAAKRMVTNSIGLAAAMETDAGSMLHLMSAVERGNIQFLRHHLHLQGVKDDYEVLEIARARINAGLRQEEGDSKTLTNQLARLGRAFGDITKEVGQLVSDALTPLIDRVTKAVAWFKSLDDSVRQITIIIAGALLLIVGAGPIISTLLSPILAVTKGLAGMALGLVELGIHIVVSSAKLVLGAVAWGVWTIAILTAKAAMLLFSGALFVTNLIFGAYQLLVGGSLGATAAWGIGMISAKILTWLFNAALTAMNALLIVPALVAAVVTVTALAGAFAIAAGVVMGLVDAGTALFSLFANAPAIAGGPLAMIGGVFGEWKGLIGDIASALLTDIPYALQLAKLSFNLAITQMQALWPPLWEFIKKGFNIAFDLVSVQFEITFLQTMKKVFRAFLDMLLGWFPGVSELIAQLDSNLDVQSAQQRKASMDKAEADLKEALKTFSSDMATVDTTAVAAAHKAIEDAKWDQAWGDLGGGKQEAEKKTFDLFADLGATATQGFKQGADKLDSVLRGSAEALGRFTAYKERLTGTGPNAGALSYVPSGASNLTGGSSSATPGTNPIWGRMLDALRDSRDSLAEIAGSSSDSADLG